MMHATHFLGVLVAALVLLAGGGCAAYRPFQIEPVGQRGAVIQPTFNNATYRVDKDKVLTVVSDTSGTDRATGKPIRQILVMRVFWVPVGGKTSLNPTSLNTTFRYIVITPDSMGQYEGAGFTRLFDKVGSRRLNLRVMDADLRLSEKTADFKDTLERSRIRGNITASFDDARTLDRTLAVQREFFYKTLERSQKPATAPGTQGASQPATTRGAP